MLRNRLGGGPGGPGGGAPAGVYQMHQQMFAIGDDFWIESGGNRVFKVDGKALRIRKTLLLEDAQGRELYKIQEKLVTIRDVMTIEGPAGDVATVKKALISPLRERYAVELKAGGEWNVQGNILDHEYEISGPAGKIAEVGKKWFRIRDTYGVQVAPNQDDALVLAVAIVVDQMSHAGR
ncbi:MAG TPA: LURP-one-related family protein [Candidatus Limnocylindrales bacterium]